MTRGFYELLGVGPRSDLDEIRAAYGRSVAHLLKRREATLVQDGDTSALDLSRAELDEAWEVLSDPARRRRYDAMLAVVGDGVADADIDDLWPRVAGAMIPPATASAARVVDALTELRLGPFPEPPRPEPLVAVADAFADAAPTTRALPSAEVDDPSYPGDDRDTEDPLLSAFPDHGAVAGDSTVPTQVPSEVDPRGASPEHPPGVIRLVPTPAPVPTPLSDGPPRATAAGTVDVEALVDAHGMSGALVAALREARGLTLHDLSSRTSITVRYFEAIEREDLSALPTGITYLRGYLRKTAELLGLDAERFVEGYIRRVRDDE